MAGAVSTVIENLRKYVERYKDPYSCPREIEGTAELMEEAADMLEHMMLVIQQNNFKDLHEWSEWIPCKERFPKPFKRVLIQLKNNIIIVGCRSTKALSEELCWQSRDEEFEDSDVIAWCELPEPYREDVDE